MSRFLLCMLTAVFGFATLAWADAGENEWRWIRTEANGDHWNTLEGVGQVEITGDKIHILLREAENGRLDRFDMHPEDSIGTYWRAVRRDGESTEIIVLDGEVSATSLIKVTKAPVSPDTPSR